MAVTIDDVAKAAGVSSSTVSYALSGKRPISPHTRARVEAAIKRLGYYPNAKARALASNRTNLLALVAPLRDDNNVPVIMQFVAAIAAAAREADHDILLVTQAEGEQGLRRVSQAALVDALIVMDVQVEDGRVPLLRKLDIPSVLIGRPGDTTGLSSVDLDFYQAATVSVDHLADLGHRKIVLFGSAPAVYQRRSSYAERFAQGFRDRTSARDVKAEVEAVEPRFEDAFGLVRQHLTADPEATSFIVHNEAVLGTVLAAIRAEGRSVPEDISVVVLCPEDMAKNQSVELTGVAVPAEQIGRAAVEIALRGIGHHVDPEVRLVAPRLTVRSSTAPAVRRQRRGTESA